MRDPVSTWMGEGFRRKVGLARGDPPLGPEPEQVARDMAGLVLEVLPVQAGFHMARLQGALKLVPGAEPRLVTLRFPAVQVAEACDFKSDRPSC